MSRKDNWNLDLEDVTPELLAHLEKLRSEAPSMSALAPQVGVHFVTLCEIRRGKRPRIRRATFERIMDVAPEQIAWAPQASMMRELERRRLGLITYQPVPLGEKDRYAAHLSDRGWNLTDITRSLHMSWSRAKFAVEKYGTKADA